MTDDLTSNTVWVGGGSQRCVPGVPVRKRVYWGGIRGDKYWKPRRLVARAFGTRWEESFTAVDAVCVRVGHRPPRPGPVRQSYATAAFNVKGNSTSATHRCSFSPTLATYIVIWSPSSLLLVFKSVSSHYYCYYDYYYKDLKLRCINKNNECKKCTKT